MRDPAPTNSTSPAVSALGRSDELRYSVPGMSCSHCERSVSDEVRTIAGVQSVAVDLESKLVRVYGAGVQDAAVRAAIDEAGYEAVPA